MADRRRDRFTPDAEMLPAVLLGAEWVMLRRSPAAVERFPDLMNERSLRRPDVIEVHVGEEMTFAAAVYSNADVSVLSVAGRTPDDVVGETFVHWNGPELRGVVVYHVSFVPGFGNWDESVLPDHLIAASRSPVRTAWHAIGLEPSRGRLG